MLATAGKQSASLSHSVDAGRGSIEVCEFSPAACSHRTESRVLASITCALHAIESASPARRPSPISSRAREAPRAEKIDVA
jgi:hypothetical protein